MEKLNEVLYSKQTVKELATAKKEKNLKSVFTIVKPILNIIIALPFLKSGWKQAIEVFIFIVEDILTAEEKKVEIVEGLAVENFNLKEIKKAYDLKNNTDIDIAVNESVLIDFHISQA